MAAKKKKKAKAKTGELPLGDGPGVGVFRIPSIDRAAAEYVIVRDARIEASKEEVPAKKKLTDLLHKHADRIGRDSKGAMHYQHEDVELVLEPTDEKLTVKKAKAPKDEGE